MKICAISDLHGWLRDDLPNCDVVVICGDTVPLYCQRSVDESTKWMVTTFFPWVESLDCQYVIMIAGNHDFTFEYHMDDGTPACLRNSCPEKLIYLENKGCAVSVAGEERRFFGTPWCTGPQRWAFVEESGKHYRDIEDCDVLLTHQPPKLGEVGVSRGYYSKPDYGSEVLLEEAKKHTIRYWFCGHIHSGDHSGVYTSVKDGQPCKVYNVSQIDEGYMPMYKPCVIEI